MKVSSSLGTVLLSIWLMLTGLISLIHLNFAGLGVIMAVIALVAGFLTLVGR
jgi:hypothetical protein